MFHSSWMLSLTSVFEPVGGQMAIDTLARVLLFWPSTVEQYVVTKMFRFMRLLSPFRFSYFDLGFCEGYAA